MGSEHRWIHDPMLYTLSRNKQTITAVFGVGSVGVTLDLLDSNES